MTNDWQEQERTNWEGRSDKELAQEAERGWTGQGSVVEAMTRLNRSTNKAAWAMIGLTVVLVVLTLVLVGLTITLVKSQSP